MARSASSDNLLARANHSTTKAAVLCGFGFIRFRKFHLRNPFALSELTSRRNSITPVGQLPPIHHRVQVMMFRR